MVPAPDLVNLSRLQFAATAMFHFLFVPLTLGLAALLAIMETVYVMTNKPIWRDMTKFWGVLFGINFAMGVATGITMEFQFGTNWAYYSHYVGDIFGAPLAIEGMMAFFLEATFVGLFFFGWKKLSQLQHLTVTWLVALGTNFSALWILIANGWMNHPIGAKFNPATMRMEVTNFAEVIFNPVAQAKFVHTVSAGYVTGAIFVLSISAYYMLRKRVVPLARRSFVVAAAFGLASALSVVVLGDESGYTASQSQHMKLAAMEAMWKTEPAPASFTVFAIPDQKTHENHFEVKIPYLLGLIATRSFNQQVPGIDDLVEQNKTYIRDGLLAYKALQAWQKNNNDQAAMATLQQHDKNLGYAYLLKRYREDIENATPEQIDQAASDTVPKVWPLFWGFRIMVGCGFFFILLFATSMFFVMKRGVKQQRWLLWLAFLSMPLPWIAIELGWFVAEYGRQPWVVDGMLPTFLGTSSISAGHVLASLIGFVLFYGTLAVVDVYLMKRTIQLGPEDKGYA